MTQSTRERSLTPTEKNDRTQVLLGLLDERDTIRLRVRASRDELRQWRVEARNLEAQIDDVRSEIRTGVVTESAQPDLPFVGPNGQTVQRYGVSTLDALTREARASVALDNDPECGTRVITPAYECCECLGTMQQCDLNGSLQWVCPKCDHPDIVQQAGISGSSDEPDEETDPPVPDPYWTFRQNYPAASDNEELRLALANCLAPHELNLIDWDTVKSWHPRSGVFDAVAHWARVQNAHQVHKNREPTKGITIPARFPMPGELQKALASSQPKAKAPRKKATTRKATP